MSAPASRGDPTFSALVEAAVLGDRAAQASLYARLHPPIRRALVAAGKRGHPHSVDDLTQLTWLSLWAHDARRLRAYDHRRGVTPESYACMVARSLAAAAARKQRELLVDDASVVEGAAADLEARIIARSILRRAVRELRTRISLRDLRICFASFISEEAGCAVARRVGVTPQVVANVRFRARRAAGDVLGHV